MRKKTNLIAVSAIALGLAARLILQMGPEPNKEWGSAAEAAPPSMTKAGLGI